MRDSLTSVEFPSAVDAVVRQYLLHSLFFAKSTQSLAILFVAVLRSVWRSRTAWKSSALIARLLVIVHAIARNHGRIDLLVAIASTSSTAPFYGIY